MNKRVPFSPPLDWRSKSGDFRYHYNSETNGADLPSGVFIYITLGRVLLLSLSVILCMTASYLIRNSEWRSGKMLHPTSGEAARLYSTSYMFTKDSLIPVIQTCDLISLSW